MSESFIVYRNPAEKWFWEGGGMIQVVVLVGVFLLMFLVTLKVAEWTLPEKAFAKYGNTVAIIDGLIWGIGAVAFVFYI